MTFDEYNNKIIIKMEATPTEQISTFSHLKKIQSLIKKEFSKKGISKSIIYSYLKCSNPNQR